ncbi:MAG TPA: FAD/NAD(P)-binding oxidoreductase [Paludibaculum sp.]|jgi:NADPH-dependent 2,4-dienoyl-CoA reductase/sulfur reductase-like enzyme
MTGFDLIVVGAGPAGIAAACRAAETGAKVLVLDNNPSAGGQIWRNDVPPKWAAWLSHVEFRGGCAVIDDSLLAHGVPIVLATGARELYLPFPGWTLPGVTGAGGLQALVKSGFDVRGKRAVLAGTGPLLLAVASLLRKRGASVTCIAEQAPRPALLRFAAAMWQYPSKLAQGIELGASLLGVPFFPGTWVQEAFGRKRVERVRLNGFEQDCDLLAVGYGLVPNTELAQLLGCTLQDGFVTVDSMQKTWREGVWAAGELTGIGGVERSLVEGEIAGLAAIGELSEARKLFSRRAAWHRFAARLGTAFELRPELRALSRPDTIVCRCEDIRYEDLTRWASAREAKLQTRCGMGLCQGRICGAANQVLFGWQDTSVRPPASAARVSDLMES